MKLFQKKKNNKGFSLVELIVVVAIMAVLLGVLVPTLIRHVESSRLSKDKTACDEIKNAVEAALASEKFMDATCSDVDLFDSSKGIDLSKLSVTGVSDGNGGSAAFLTEVKANLGEASTIALNSKLKKGCTIKLTIANEHCTISVVPTDNSIKDKDDYKFEV